jgi:hypothetical protein
MLLKGRPARPLFFGGCDCLAATGHCWCFMNMLFDLVLVRNAPATLEARSAQIRQAMIRQSPTLREPNFTHLTSADVALLFHLYDRAFFDGRMAVSAAALSGQPLTFRLAPKATIAGGKTTTHYTRVGGERRITRFDIAIAPRLLMLTFNGDGREVVVCGHACRDRLEAMQRIMEHEMIHLGELLVWQRSSCAGRRFHALARNIFGHTAFHHDLVTPREHAATQYNIRLGDRVSFEFDGQTHIGIVNRVHTRATVLVESPDGAPYRDGRRYRKYYIPLGLLRTMP